MNPYTGGFLRHSPAEKSCGAYFSTNLVATAIFLKNMSIITINYMKAPHAELSSRLCGACLIGCGA
jgi:hypothetical protein